VATKMVSRLTPVDTPKPVANSAMNAIAMHKRAFGLVVKFRARIGPTIKIVAVKMLNAFNTWTRRRSWKNWILPGSRDANACSDKLVKRWCSFPREAHCRGEGPVAA
jgi:hypothetical protein